MANDKNQDTAATREEKAAELFEKSSFFGRRKGLKLSPRKEKLLDEFLPTLLLDPLSPEVADPANFFDKSYDNYRLEIGFGGGEHLVEQAKTHPEIGFIGVEPFINGMAKILGRIEDESITNIRLYNEDAGPLIDWLPDDTFLRADLLYPDPWHKKRHWKRRFVSQNNLERIYKLLKKDGEFRFASDIESYINWTLWQVETHGKLAWKAKRADDWREPWAGWHRTRYEAKAIREGRTPAYLIFGK
jgi:tRNA (guanine-N7-)-methyltransferase